MPKTSFCLSVSLCGNDDKWIIIASKNKEYSVSPFFSPESVYPISHISHKICIVYV